MDAVRGRDTDGELVPTGGQELSRVEPSEIADIDTQIRTANAYPRDIEKVRSDIRKAVSNPIVAETMWYTLKRYDKKKKEYVYITGPSVRLAEVMFSSWRNVGIDTLISHADGHSVTARAFAIDFEKNVRMGTSVTVPVLGTHSDAITLAQQRAQAFARRNIIFQIIPGVYTREALQHARDVYSKTPKLDRQRKMLAYFAENGVTPEKVCAAVDKQSPEELTDADLDRLRGMANQIIDDNKRPDESLTAHEEERAEQASLDLLEPEEGDANAAELKALEIDAKKKHGKAFLKIWSNANLAAKSDPALLRQILSAPTGILEAALREEEPVSSLLQLAQTAKKLGSP